MNRLLFLLICLIPVQMLSAQEYSWEKVSMDGSRTGCVSPSKDKVSEALGTFRGGKYIAPDGSVHKRNSSAARTARIVMEAQPAMARVKDVIGFSPEVMESHYPESALSDWFVDLLMAKTEEYTGKKVHIGVANFGGIRIDMPEGDIILDDMLSMFPFKNQLVYVEHTGRQIKKILDDMAARRFQVLGGVRIVAEHGKIVSAEIDGKPIEDDAVYGMATISFLLEGGDGLALAENAVSVNVLEDVDIIDAVLEFVYAETAAGRPIQYQTDGRLVIKDLKRRK